MRARRPRWTAASLASAVAAESMRFVPPFRMGIKPETASAEMSRRDQLPERIRQMLYTCDFDLDMKAVMRFSKDAERKGYSDEKIAAVFDRIKTHADSEKFNRMWGNS